MDTGMDVMSDTGMDATPDRAADTRALDAITTLEAAPDAASSGDASDAAPGVRLIGRFDTTVPNQASFQWSASAIEANFTGSSVSVQLGGPINYFVTLVDGVMQPVLVTSATGSTYSIATGLGAGMHNVLVFRRDEATYGGVAVFSGFTFGGGGQLLAPPPAPNRRIELIGDSISCGYGNLCTNVSMAGSIQNEDEYVSYGPLTARALGADLHVVAWSGKGMYRNGDGTTTGTMPSLWQRTIPSDATSHWDPSQWVPDAVVINLGTNDYRMTPDPTAGFQSTYLAFVTTLRAAYPGAYIFCTLGPMMMDPNLSLARTAINNVISMRRASGDRAISLVEFTPENCGSTGAGCGCDDHPNTAIDQTMADTLTAAIQSSLGW